MAETRELLADGVRAERGGALDRALEAYEAAASAAIEPSLQAEALTRRADVLRSRCEWDRAMASAREAQDIARRAGLTDLVAEAVIAEANILTSQGNFGAATPKLQGVATSRTHPRVRAIALQNLGSIHAQLGQFTAAERAFSDSLAEFHEAGYARGEAIALNNLGRLALDAQDPEHARVFLDDALQIAREIQDSELAALVSLNLASALCSRHEDVDRAQDLAMAALGYFAGCQNSWREIECLRLIGDINVRCEDIDKAARCYDLALKLSELIGSAVEIETSRGRIAALPVSQTAAERLTTDGAAQ